VVRVKGSSKAALLAAATRECEHQTAAPRCERVLVVYGEHAANLYIESTPAPRPTASRRSA
jgi:Iap family predicted aminopeptidase